MEAYRQENAMEIADILEQYNVEMDTTGRGKNRPGWINIACCFCGKDPYLGIHIEKCFACCWACGYHPLWQVISFITGLPTSECSRLARSLPRREESEVTRPKKTGTLKMPRGLDHLSNPHRDYLRSRGFKPRHIAQQWAVQGLGPFVERRLSWRLFIPVYVDGLMVSWTTRAIGEKEPRYLSAYDEDSEISINDCIYGIDYVGSTIVLVEGPIDVWTIGPGAAALMGLKTSPCQLARLSNVPRRVICFDSEPDAQERARRLANDLSCLPGSTMQVTLCTGKDPNSADPAEIATLKKAYLT
jgi:hypothetical protein